jgi:hypothetical protein
MGSIGPAPVIDVCCSSSYPKLSHFMPRDDDRVRLKFASIARQLYTSARRTGTRMTILRLHGARQYASRSLQDLSLDNQSHALRGRVVWKVSCLVLQRHAAIE